MRRIWDFSDIRLDIPMLLRARAPVPIMLLVLTVLGGCDDRATKAVKPPAFVRTEIVRLQDRGSSATLTGDVEARIQTELSFRVSGRVVVRLADVGAHVDAGDVLARLDPKQQQADFDAATANLAAAELQLQVAASTFQRQKTLIANGFTTRVAFDTAEEGLRTAEGSLDSAKARLGRSKEALADTVLRASAAGVVTARNVEVGQVMQPAQSAFTLAQDGDRDAVFDVSESVFFREPEDKITITLLSNRDVTAVGRVREVSPAIDAKSSTVRVKVAIENPPAAMTLGSAIAGTARWKPMNQIVVPWNALMATGATPAVWVVDPQTRTVSLKPVTVDTYETGVVVVHDGLQPGERVVIDGGKLLSVGQSVSYEGGAS
ncbi:efflux RND transporter periplasmic adaptor subunit [Bradyrhizobium commune]|nr:efflux RND transporter periplasmic adaptor subunit [Bradyrhizobium commune]